MSSTTAFAERVKAVIDGMDTSGLIDRFAANDILLDLLDQAGTDEESDKVMKALADLPKSSLVDREMLARLLSGLCGQN